MYKDRCLSHWALFSFLLVLGKTGDVHGALLQRREDPPQQTLFIPLRFDGQKYFVNVAMSSGAGEQDFDFALSTGTGYTVVAGTDCPSCGSSRSYNESESTTVQQLPAAQNVSILGTTASGPLVLEDCHLTQTNGSAWLYPNQTIIVANQTQSILSSKVSGIIGLGTNARNGDFGSTVYSGWLSRHPGVTNFTFGMALNPPTPDAQSDGGVLHWVSPDTTAYEGDLIWREMKPSDPSTGNSSISAETDWFIGLDSWSFVSGSGATVLQNGGNMVAAIEPLYSTLIFPQSAARTIYSNVQGAQLLSSSPTPTNLWSLPCDAKMELSLTFGSLNVTLKEDLLLRQQGGICIGTVEQWADESASEYLLGSSFASVIYIIFSVSAANGSSIGLAQRKAQESSSHLTGGVIAGIVLGGLAFVLMVIVTAILIRDSRRKRRERTQPNSHPFFLQRTQGSRLPPSPYSTTGFADAQYASYTDTPISPSYHELTPSSLPPTPNTRFLHQNGLLYLPRSPPLTPPTGHYWEPSAYSGVGQFLESGPQMKSLQAGVSAYAVPVASTSVVHPSQSDHDTTQMTVQLGISPPPAYELSDQTPSNEEQQPRERQKKRRIVLTR